MFLPSTQLRCFRSFRSVRNFRIDLTAVAGGATGLHWQVSQATSLTNVVVDMSQGADSQHQGIYMENGSGGFMGDLVFNGGKFGIWVGNQQSVPRLCIHFNADPIRVRFTVRNITINNAVTAIHGSWNWGWTFQRVTINDCSVGFELQTGSIDGDAQTVAGEAIIDAVVSNTPVFVQSTTATTSLAGSLVLNNIQLTNVTTAVGIADGSVVLEGGTTTIASWGQGNVYEGTGTTGTFVQGEIVSANKPSSLLDGNGHIFGKGYPQYEAYAPSQFVSVKTEGAV